MFETFQSMGWKRRLSVVLSAVWLLLVFTISDHDRIAGFVGLGVLPLAILWGAGWAIAGYLAQRQQAISSQAKPTLMEQLKAVLTERAVLIIAVLLGWTLIAQIFSTSDVARHAGEWFVYALIGYGLSTWIGPLKPVRGRIVAAVFLCGLAWVSGKEHYANIAMAKDLQSLASLVPQLQNNDAISEEQIKSTGMFEPALRVAIANLNTQNELAAEYLKTIESASVSTMLTPKTLSSLEARQAARLRASNLKISLETLRIKFDSFYTDMPKRFELAASNIPERGRSEFVKGIIRSNDENQVIYQKLLKINNEVLDIAEDFFALSDKANPKAIGGQIYFTNDADLASYRRLFVQMQELSKQENEQLRKIYELDSKRTDKLTNTIREMRVLTN